MTIKVTTFTLGLLGGAMLSASAAIIPISVDAGDGVISRDPSPVTLTSNATATSTRVGISGSSGDSSRTQNNAIYFFELPALGAGEIVTSGNLSILYLDKLVSVGGLNFNVDVWGLGYVSTPTLDTDWLLFANTDGAAGVGVPDRTKIEDNILTPASDDPDFTSVLVNTDSFGDVNMASFVNSLYSNGAEAGDYAVIRMNPDANQNPDGPDGTPGYTIGFFEDAGSTPMLTLNTAVIPEPAAMGALLGCASLMLAGIYRRRC